MKIISDILLDQFRAEINFSPVDIMNGLADEEIALDYFDFNNSVSSVYSSRIEGEKIELDSYLKHRFQNVEFLPDLTKTVDDLFNAYVFIKDQPLNRKNIFEAHGILSANILPNHLGGTIRKSMMQVINQKGQSEYVAPDQYQVDGELEKLFSDIEFLMNEELDDLEVFYYASFIHFVFAKIHPMSDGNGRSARLLEKWFLIEKFGENAFAVPLERNYFNKLSDYYLNLKRAGFDYEDTDYSKALPFILMTVNSLNTEY